MQSWVEGSLATLDHLSAQYLFAAATVLAISSLSLSSNSPSDKEDFESSSHLLKQLRDSGNISAQEFYHQLEIVMREINTFEAGRAAFGATTNLDSDTALRPDPVTSELGIFGPLVQDFLSQTDAELGVPLPLDDVVFDVDFWSTMSTQDETWAA